MIIGIIGFGSIGNRHFQNLRMLYPKAVIKVLTKRKDITFGDNAKVISSEKDFFKNKIDVFFITNETYKHAGTVLKCLKNNPRGIFVEKPLSHTLVKLNQIGKELKKKKTVFFVGYCLQFYKPLSEIKKIIQKGIIGEVLFIRVSAGQDLRNWRKRNYKNIYSYSTKKGGGVVLDLIHEINYPAWLLGEKISFLGGAVSRVGLFDMRSEDMSEGIFKSESGKLISIHQDYLQASARRYCEVVGAKGTILWDSVSGEIKIIFATKLADIIKPAKNDMYVDELKFFMKKVSENKGFNNFDEALGDLKNALVLKTHYAK